MPLGNSFLEKEVILNHKGEKAGLLIFKASFFCNSQNNNNITNNPNTGNIYISSYNDNGFSNITNNNDFPSFDDIIDNNNYNPKIDNKINLDQMNQNNLNNNNNSNFNNFYQMNQNNLNNNSNNNNFNNFNNNNNNLYNVNNNNNHQQMQTTLWQQWLNYSKTPLFFKSRTPEIYLGNLDSKTFNHSFNLNFNLPLYSSKCEIPDCSIFVTGGDNNDDTINTCFIYNPNSGLLFKRNMNMARKLHNSIFLDGFVYVFGGYDGNNISNFCEKYDVKNNTWTGVSNLNVPRAYTSLLRYGKDYIFVIGGACGMGDEVIYF